MGFDLQQFIIMMAVLILAITIHEFSHAFSADRLGDPTPRKQGRISLLPIDHLDPLGTLMMAISSYTGFGIGWGKPVMTNPGNFKNPRRDQAITAIAGPVSNLIQAAVYAGILHVLIQGGTYNKAFTTFALLGVIINLSLAFFNLIPISPLDGSWIMTALLPYNQAMAYQRWMLSYGPLVFIGIILFEGQLHIISSVIGPPVYYCARMLGVPF